MPDIDHRTMTPPFLRLRESIDVDRNCSVSVWDLRITQPNVSALHPAIAHSMEHLLSTQLTDLSGGAVLVVAPMGCLTGFYIVSTGPASFSGMGTLLETALRNIGSTDIVPLAEDNHCGAARAHDLAGAKAVASWLISRRSEWHLSSHLDTKN